MADDVGRVMQEGSAHRNRTLVRPGSGGAPTVVGQGGAGARWRLSWRTPGVHFVVSVGPMAVGAAMAGLRTSVGVKALTTRLAERLAGGAAVRAAGPVLGRAAGFIVAAAAGVGIDIALRKLDELLNRDELEESLTALVDEEKEKVKAVLSSAVDEVKAMALGDFVPSQLR